MSEKFESSSFLYNANSRFVEELYQKYLTDPDSIDASWVSFFKNYQIDKNLNRKILYGASWAPTQTKVLGAEDPEGQKAPSAQKCVSLVKDDSLHKVLLTHEFRRNGHMLAQLDPLGLDISDAKIEIKELGFAFPGDEGDLSVSLKNTLLHLQETYCRSVGFEFAHITSAIEQDWLYQEAERLSSLRNSLTGIEKKQMLYDLIEAEGFEQFLHSRFPGAKRFSVEGGESTLVCIQEIITQASRSGVVECIVGMPHRGRLNVLTKIFKQSYSYLFSKFRENFEPDSSLEHYSSDVKYHAGKSTDTIIDGKKIHLSLAYNPSHLEAVNPVVQGKIRAIQDLIGDEERKRVFGIILHGDAAFAGQGVVPESLMLSNLDGYKTGGIVHIVVNNQVGFTASPKKARSSRYSTEIAKTVSAPIIHVNSEDVEAVLLVSRMAELYRQKFQKDVVIDLVCYRKYGHNEGDEPMFTQPVMYNVIKNKQNPHKIYFNKLKQRGVITEGEYKLMHDKFTKMLDEEYQKSEQPSIIHGDWLQGRWSTMSEGDRSDPAAENTGVDLDILQTIGKSISSYPEGFKLNSKVERLLKAKNEMFATGKNFDWATAEALAFGSLLLENIPVRLSGQDCGRGTFSHRHAVYVDQENEKLFIPLNNINQDQARFEVIDSSLSEYAVLGFEYGYSTAHPQMLNLWEAQFGDFSNGAQIVIDQFISSAEAKWLRMSGLVMLLPHGFEGQGPEHSSARLERYLQLCAQQNMQVVNCSTPANYFHALRRQVCRNFRIPLIIVSPKSLLRAASSELKDFVKDSKFIPVINEIENIDQAGEIKRVILCSGKVYYDLLEKRKMQGITNVALIRLEQYYPFPAKYLEEILQQYNNAEFIWCQEEPKNMGAWNFICHYYEESLKNLGFKNNRPKYIGRKENASPATGFGVKFHTQEQELFMLQALKLS
jgi:2-oxoglutarate dehydrogenase E1 component